MRGGTARRSWGWGFAVAAILRPALLRTHHSPWSDGEQVPADGGCILAINHVSHADPLVTAHFVYDHGRIPRYLAKSGPVPEQVRRRCPDAPPGRSRSSGSPRNAVGAYDAAVRPSRDGECVVVYPEGTLTRDPDLWPMVGKSGAARIALATGAPVIPVGAVGRPGAAGAVREAAALFPRKPVDEGRGPGATSTT